MRLNLPEPGEYGIDIYASESKKKRTFSYACQYLVLYLAEEEKSSFVEEISRGQTLEETESGSATYVEDEKEVTELTILLTANAWASQFLTILVLKEQIHLTHFIVSEALKYENNTIKNTF